MFDPIKSLNKKNHKGACVAGRIKGGKSKLARWGEGTACKNAIVFFVFFVHQTNVKPDWSDLMNYLIHPSHWSATCHSKPQRSSHMYIQHRINQEIVSN